MPSSSLRLTRMRRACQIRVIKGEFKRSNICFRGLETPPCASGGLASVCMCAVGGRWQHLRGVGRHLDVTESVGQEIDGGNETAKAAMSPVEVERALVW